MAGKALKKAVIRYKSGGKEHSLEVEGHLSQGEVLAHLIAEKGAGKKAPVLLSYVHHSPPAASGQDLRASDEYIR